MDICNSKISNENATMICKETIDREVERIKELFSEKLMDSMPCVLTLEVFNELNKIYKSTLGCIMGIYYLGRIHEAEQKY